jgi:hypothetical protein
MKIKTVSKQIEPIIEKLKTTEISIKITQYTCLIAAMIAILNKNIYFIIIYTMLAISLYPIRSIICNTIKELNKLKKELELILVIRKI